jgi:hypothetical protein
MSGAYDMKVVKEKAVEQAFLRVMNRIISNKDAYLLEEISGPASAMKILMSN